MRPAYGMGRRSFSRPGALRFTAAPMQPACQTAGSPTGRPPRHPQRRSPTSQPPAASGAAPLHNNPRRPAAQPPLHGHPATGHEMAGKPARQPPAGPPSPAPSCINPPGHQRAPPFPSGKSAYQFPRLALPSPSGKREPAARRAPLRMPDRYIRSVVGPPARAALSPLGNANHAPSARRCTCPTATSVLWRGHPARAALPLRETRTTPPARAAAHARPLHPFCGGSTRRAPLRRGKRGCGGAENILFLIPEYPLTTA